MFSALVAANARWNLDIRIDALSRTPQRFIDKCPALGHAPGVTWHAGDVRFFNYPKGQVDRTIHIALDAIDQAAMGVKKIHETVVGGLERVLDFCESARVERMLYLSSGAVYGPQPAGMEFMPESYPGAPHPEVLGSTYAHAKRYAEHLCAHASRSESFDAPIARCFSFVGPLLAMREHFAVGNFIADALTEERIRVNGDGSPIRAFQYAADTTIWFLTILEKGVGGRPYNIGGDEPVSMAQLAERTRDILAPGKPIEIQKRDGAGAGGNRYAPDLTRAREELGLVNRVSLDESIRRTGAYCREQGLERWHTPATPTYAAPKRLVVDIDGVIASLVPDLDYAKAEPLTDTIDAINALYDAGTEIVLFTARGSASGIDWRPVTEAQMQRWGVKHHELRLGKPHADYYIDDKLITPTQMQNMAAEARKAKERGAI
ncbi:putative NAD-dependent epimerase/dehydratase [Magnetofaba australis IT-1]|uniref:Putative NAD-dependent epimerase/dehydratase n=2 Tax=Magnetofaba TaxID=1472292 RepID=A0A1Y2K556_9PROT|nr:putative NAD-dependent epimerase/dehydratase [Magnetofaba australis IT-1]